MGKERVNHILADILAMQHRDMVRAAAWHTANKLLRGRRIVSMGVLNSRISRKKYLH